MASETFISEFHNIEGVLVGERKQNLHKLLKNKDITGDGENLILDNLKPKTFLETLLYTDVLIYLRKTVQLLEILRYGNEPCVSKIIKQPWFFKEAFNNVGAEEFVDEVLPSMSFSVKMKVLKKLSIAFPEEKMNKVFDAVLKRYGLFIASTVIPACSSQKIEYILKNNEVKLWTGQLKIIYNKQPDLIKLYLDVHKQQENDGIFDKNFLIHLAQNDPALFWYLIENHEIKDQLKLGRRTTKKLIGTKRHEIVKEPKKYIKYFRHETLVRNLNKLGEFKQFYHNLFPRNMDKLDDKNALCKKLLKYYPKQSQYKLYTETFTDVLKEDIFSNLSCLDDEFLKFIPDVGLREKLAQIKYNKSNDDEYIKYYNTERCFTLIKDKLNLTASIKERRKLLCILVKSCAINKDLKSLEKALKYFCERHRNDDYNTRNEFLNTIHSDFKLEHLNESHWKYLNEIFTMQNLNNEYTTNSELKVAYIKFLCTNNRPEDEINYGILEYLKHVIGYNRGYNTGQFHALSDIKDYEVEKRVMMQALEFFPTLIKTQKKEDQRTYFLSVVWAEIFSYNLRHPKHTIAISEEESLDTLRSILEHNYISYSFLEKFGKAICKLNRNNLENELLTFYWEKVLPQFSVDWVIRWYLKYDPLIIVENIDKVLKTSLYTTLKIWPRVKLYSHINLDDIVVKYCLKQLEDDDEEKDKSEIIRRLSILITAEHYIRIMENGNFIPTHAKLKIEDQEAKDIYKAQVAFLRNFSNLQDPLKYLPLLVDSFCQGDYLQSSLTALYSAFYKCPENDLKPYLNKLSKNRAMSAKKQALNLACCVFEQKMIFEILTVFEENEKNSSLRKSIFLSCLRYFIKNPSEELFAKVVFHMGFLEKNDKESLKILYTVNIPRNYKPSYIQHILKLLEKFKANDKEGNAAEFNNAVYLTLDIIDKHCIQELPQDFCTEIIQKYFLINEDVVPAIFLFVINVLVYRVEKSVNFDFVFKLLSNYKLQYWPDYSMIQQRENIYTFFKVFYVKACEKEITLDFVDQFSSNWGKIFTSIETFEQYVLLNLLRFKKESENDPETYAKKIVLFSEKVVEEFGQTILSKFVAVLNKSFNCKPIERTNILSNMLKFKTTTLNCILVMELIVLKQDLFRGDKIRHMYHDIDSVLKVITDPIVQLHYNLYRKE